MPASWNTMFSTADESALALISRFLTGDLPLFALEAWLAEADNPLPPALLAELRALPRHSADLHADYARLLGDWLPPGQAEKWLLETILPWLLSNEARSTRAVALCAQLMAQGQSFLAPIGAALTAGWDEAGVFDWERVKAVVPGLRPAAELILELLGRGELQLFGTSFLLGPEPTRLLSDSDWRAANQAIAAWRQRPQAREAEPSALPQTGSGLARALAAARGGDLQGAESLLQPYLHQQPAHAGALHLLALIRQAQGDAGAAIAAFESALLLGGRSEILLELGRLYHDIGQPEQASQKYALAVAEGVGLEDQDQHRYAHALLAGGQAAAAAERYGALLKKYPGHAGLWMDSGNAWLALGQPEQAQAAFARSLALQPDSALAHFNQARSYFLAGESAAAEAPLRRSLELDSSLVPAWNLLGSLQQARGELDAAEASFRRALELAPEDAPSLNNLGSCLQARYRGAEAEAAYRSALRQAPDMPEARLNLAQLQREQNQPELAQATLAPLLPQQPALRYLQAYALPVVLSDTAIAQQAGQRFKQALDALEASPVPLQDPLRQLGRHPFYLPYLGLDERPLLEQLGRLLDRAAPSLTWQAPHCQRRRRPGPWRVGLISAFFYQHTIWHLFGYLLEGLSSNGFEVSCLHAGQRSDQATDQARAQAAHFLHLPQDLARAREQIAGLELDLLLYLDIGLDPLSTYLAHARLAPIQANTWGHGVTSGLPQIDAFLASEGLIGERTQAEFSETLYQLPGFFGHWQREPNQTAEASREDYGLPAGRLYLCPHSLYKLHPDSDALLAKVLDKDPEGALVMIEGLYPQWRQALEARWQNRIDAQRVIWLERLDPQAFLGLLACGDVLLDTRPFGSGLTLLQALAQGTPIVTWPTESLKGRIGKGICQELEWFDGLARDGDDFANKAVALARSWNSAAKAALRQRFEEKISPAKMSGYVAAMLKELCERRFSE